MVSEVVRARVSVDQIEVDCVFVMKNDGPADTVLFGFPDGALGEGCDQNEFLSFRSWVDGVEVKCVRLPDADAATGDPEECPSSWWTKRIPFRRGEVRTVRDQYTVGASWHPMTGLSEFRYQLWTGASWKGSIGSAEITAILDGIPREWVTETTPEARLVGHAYHWTFRDFEPGSADGSPDAVEIAWREPGRITNPEEPDTLGR